MANPSRERNCLPIAAAKMALIFAPRSLRASETSGLGNPA